MQRPAFSSIVVGMILVMGIPAIFAAMVLKSRSFDKNRYEFDPNKTWSVLEQGRGFRDRARRPTRPSRLEMERLALERKNLVNNVKKLDESMLALRAVAGTSRGGGAAVPGRLAVAGRGAEERRARRPAAAPRLHRAAGRPPRDGRQYAGGRRAVIAAPATARPRPCRRPGRARPATG